MMVDMKDFKANKYSGKYSDSYKGGKGFGGKGGYIAKDGGSSGKPSYHKGDTTMYDATCSDCGKSCQVPFRPVGSKPVKCRDCFVDKREGQEHTFSNKYSQERREGGPRGDANTRSESATLSAVDQKAIADMKVQIDSLHTKLNTILDILNK